VLDGFADREAFFKFHNTGLDEEREMQLVAWITKAELFNLIRK